MRSGLSLEDLSTRTKVSVELWDAMERNDFSRWPTGVAARSYIRSYAEAVGVDPDGDGRRVLPPRAQRRSPRRAPRARHRRIPRASARMERRLASGAAGRRPPRAGRAPGDGQRPAVVARSVSAQHRRRHRSRGRRRARGARRRPGQNRLLGDAGCHGARCTTASAWRCLAARRRPGRSTPTCPRSTRTWSSPSEACASALPAARPDARRHPGRPNAIRPRNASAAAGGPCGARRQPRAGDLEDHPARVADDIQLAGGVDAEGTDAAERRGAAERRRVVPQIGSGRFSGQRIDR